MSCGDCLPRALVAVLARLPRLTLAFSGGLDSRFLAHAAQLCGCRLLAVHARGPHVDPAESAAAKAWLTRRGISFIEISHDPLVLPEARRNDRRRCYYCKAALFAAIKRAAEACPGGSRVLCDGGQADDLHGYRPGLAAAREAGVFSPLAMAGMGKAEIRQAAIASGLDNPGQKARPCLLTRFNYGMEATAPLLAALAACEAELAALLGPDLDFRLRLRPRPLLQAAGSMGDAAWPQAKAIMARHGFAGAELMERGAVSGFFDGAASGDHLPARP